MAPLGALLSVHQHIQYRAEWGKEEEGPMGSGLPAERTRAGPWVGSALERHDSLCAEALHFTLPSVLNQQLLSSVAQPGLSSPAGLPSSPQLSSTADHILG